MNNITKFEKEVNKVITKFGLDKKESKSLQDTVAKLKGLSNELRVLKDLVKDDSITYFNI